MNRDQYKATVLAGPDCPEKRFLLDLQKQQKLDPEPKPVQLVPVTKGWACDQGHEFDYPLHDGVGCCPMCGTIKIHLRPEPGATEPDEIKPLPTGHVVLTGEIPAADEAFFNQPASAD